MAYNELIDGNLTVLGTLTISNVAGTAAGTQNFTGTQNFSGTANFTTASAVYFTATTLTLTASSTSSANVSACTMNSRAGKITTTALTTLSNTTFQLLVTNSVVSTADLIFWSITNGTNTAATNPQLGAKLVSAGAVTLFANVISGAALNGTLVFDFVIFK